jgi:hypothetical protein
MVDRLSLEIVGFIFGAVTAVVIGIGVFVVHSHLQSRTLFDRTAMAPVTTAMAPVAASVVPVALASEH